MKYLRKINERFSDGQFIAVLKQNGEGCDYTIGCGLTVINLESESFADARVELINTIEEEYTGDSALSSAIIYEIKDFEKIDLKSIYDSVSSNKKNEEDRLQDIRDKDEYERLQKKFGK